MSSSYSGMQKAKCACAAKEEEGGVVLTLGKVGRWWGRGQGARACPAAIEMISQPETDD